MTGKKHQELLYQIPIQWLWMPWHGERELFELPGKYGGLQILTREGSQLIKNQQKQLNETKTMSTKISWKKSKMGSNVRSLNSIKTLWPKSNRF